MTPAGEDYTVRGTLVLQQPRELPPVLDVLVAGAGPAGTAGAFRATELGLSCLVIDADDIMRRIRDFEDDKKIYPHYGGGESVPFPPGGELIHALHFSEPVHKDEIVAQWRRKYQQFGVPAKIATELTALSRGADEIWEVVAWNRRAQQEVRYRARNVLLAIGAGSPRSFEVPGNLEGIKFLFPGAKRYVGAPALVIGGGTSAAEAVIAVSNAKAAAGDASAVYWSYRNAQMPKIEKGLSAAFFDAYTGNGNIRYLPFSEPAAVFAVPGKEDYLSVRVDRKVVEGRPMEAVHLEFPKPQVVACIGEDVPYQLLQNLGIKLPIIKDQPQILLNGDGESSQANVFMVGDVRGNPYYYRCSSFEDVTATYKRIRENRNIKTAMWEAVRAVEVMAVRLGKLQAVQAVEPAAAPAAPKPAVAPPPQPVSMQEPARQPAEPTHGAELVSLLSEDAVEKRFAITTEVTRIGRKTDGVQCDDPHLAEHHATLTKRGSQYIIEDTGAGSGVWLRARGQVGHVLAEGDFVWVGAQVLMATKQAGKWAVAHYDASGVRKSTYEVGADGLFVGKSSAAQLDAKDKTLSRRHAHFLIEEGKLTVSDVGSLNGTYVRLSAPTPLCSGDEIRVGTKRLRFESFEHEEVVAPGAVSESLPLQPPAAPGVAPAGGLVVSVEHAEAPVTFPMLPDQYVLESFFDYVRAQHPDCNLSDSGHAPYSQVPEGFQAQPLDWQCFEAECGLCVAEIVDGAANFAPPDPRYAAKETTTLKKRCRVEPDLNRYRLTCRAKIVGPVKLKTLE
jgi:thioredoxin reductase/pSer/pThr/pTyr-binding forkhead associated (FHA) protein/ferredoxin